MDAVLRALAIYVFLFVVFRLAGKRTLAQVTTFDFVLLLIIGEATQQGLLGNDFSITTALLVITTLISLDIGMSLLQQHMPALGKYIEGLPVIIVDHGKPVERALRRARIQDMDILERARHAQGLERMDQIRYAVLERDGSISIVPESGG